MRTRNRRRDGNKTSVTEGRMRSRPTLPRTLAALACGLTAWTPLGAQTPLPATLTPAPLHAPLAPSAAQQPPDAVRLPGEGDRARNEQAVILTPEYQLLQLMQKEQELLLHFGPEHPEILAIRARLGVVRSYIASKPAPAPVAPTPVPQPVATQPAPAPATAAQDEVLVPVTFTVPAPASTIGLLDVSQQARLVPLQNNSGEVKFQEPPLAGPYEAFARSNEQLAALTGIPNPAERLGSGLAGTEGTSFLRPESQTALPQVIVQAAESPAAPPSLLGSAALQLITTLPAMCMGLFVHLAALVFVFRRYGANLGPLFRVELVNGTTGTITQVAPPPTVPAHNFLANEPLSEAAALAQQDLVIDIGPSTAQQFDLGPTFEEEQKLLAEAERQKEEAILRQLFDQNQVLREQLVALQNNAA